MKVWRRNTWVSPGDLLEQVKEAASKEAITPEELVRDAVEKRLNARGLRPSDVGKAIAELRRVSEVPPLAQTVDLITPENRYAEVSSGPEIGRESVER